MALLNATPETLEASLKALEGHPAPHFVLFTADPDPATGKPWCPDCARSQEVIRDGIKATGGTLLEVEVGPWSAWKTPAHPIRHDERFKITGIPTLFKVAGGQFGARVGPELEAAVTQPEIERVLDGFLAS